MSDVIINESFAKQSPVNVSSFQSLAAECHAEAPAAEAWVVYSNFPDGQRLFLIKRGDQRHYGYENDGIGLSERELKAEADRRNAAIGVSPAAAGALDLDRAVSFSVPPTQPAVYALAKTDRLALRQARETNRPIKRPASQEWLDIKTDTHGAGINGRIYRGSIRHSHLMAHFEVWDWAYRNGRKTLRTMLPTEIAAQKVCRAAQSLATLDDSYKPFSHQEAAVRALLKDVEGAARIRAADPVERRKQLLILRKKRRPALRRLFAAITAYRRARAALNH